MLYNYIELKMSFKMELVSIQVPFLQLIDSSIDTTFFN